MVPVDVHLILRRDGGEAGPEVLLSRRVGPVYATGMWHLPSGHLDPGEDMVRAVVREAEEETGVRIATEDVTLAVTVHHDPPESSRSRFGLFFEVRRWSGTPGIREPDRCDGMGWYPLDALPAPMVAYCRAGLDAYRAGLPGAVHFQSPGDPVAHADHLPSRTRLVPGRLPPETTTPPEQPPLALRDFAERAVGRVARITDVSWTRSGSRVWRLDGPDGGRWYLKRHRGPRFHDREVAAYRSWCRHSAPGHRAWSPPIPRSGRWW